MLLNIQFWGQLWPKNHSQTDRNVNFLRKWSRPHPPPPDVGQRGRASNVPSEEGTMPRRSCDAKSPRRMPWSTVFKLYFNRHASRWRGGSTRRSGDFCSCFLQLQNSDKMRFWHCKLFHMWWQKNTHKSVKTRISKDILCTTFQLWTPNFSFQIDLTSLREINEEMTFVHCAMCTVY